MNVYRVHVFLSGVFKMAEKTLKMIHARVALPRQKTDDNIEKIGNMVRSGRRLSIRAIAETVGIDKECIRKILHNNFNIHKVCAKMVPKILTFEQQEARKNVSTDTLNAIENDPNLLERIITCDKSWFFTYDPETKRQSIHWKSPTSPRAKKARMSSIKIQSNDDCFFSIFTGLCSLRFWRSNY